MGAEESQIERADRLKDDKKAAAAYLKRRAEELDASMARNFVAKNFSLAAHDAKRLASVMDVLGEIDLNS